MVVAPPMNGHCRSRAATSPETFGKLSRGMRVVTVVRTASEGRCVLLETARVKIIVF